MLFEYSGVNQIRSKTFGTLRSYTDYLKKLLEEGELVGITMLAVMVH